MKTLLLMRHAKSSHDAGDLPDHERPLNDRGRRDAPRLAERLKDAGGLPDRILCSTARRAKETAGLFVGIGGTVAFIDRLYHAPPDDILEVAAEGGGDAERLMIVAHNPGLEELVARLTGFTEGMPTAAIARIELPIGSWKEVRGTPSGRLVEFLKPKDEEYPPDASQ